MHFLIQKDDWREIAFDRPWAFVMVELVEHQVLKVCDSMKHKNEAGEEVDGPNFAIAKPGFRWTKLPDRMKVIGSDGKQIKPSRGRFFWVTTETFNPFHGLCEAGDYGPDAKRG